MRFSTEEDTKMQGGKVSNFYEGGLKHAVDKLERDVFLVLNKLQVGEVSNPIMREDRGGNPYFVIFKVDGRSDAHKANLRDDYLLFKRMAEAEMRLASLEKWINRKLSNTYVRLSEEFKDCQFSFPWLADQP
jgi:peptidyl-prolyl cis-trans isomerase SurA